jgi:hypothetical protein
MMKNNENSKKQKLQMPKTKNFFVIHCFMCLQCPITYVYEKWTIIRPGTSMKKVINQNEKYDFK